MGQLRPAAAVDAPPGIEWCDALVDYEGAGRDLVVALKYRNRRGAVDVLGAALAERARARGAPFDVVSWVPTSARRRRRRGFDQAELLARSVGRRLGVPVRRLLRRTGGPQTGRDRRHRLDGPGFELLAFVPGSVLLIDDVVTTGASMGAAATALRAGGADRVAGLVLARTAPAAWVDRTILGSASQAPRGQRRQ